MAPSRSTAQVLSRRRSSQLRAAELDQQNETKRKVEVMRQRVQEWESKRMARQLSMAFNTLQQESLSRGAARQHWLKGASMAAALNLARF